MPGKLSCPLLRVYRPALVSARASTPAPPNHGACVRTHRQPTHPVHELLGASVSVLIIKFSHSAGSCSSLLRESRGALPDNNLLSRDRTFGRTGCGSRHRLSADKHSKAQGQLRNDSVIPLWPQNTYPSHRSDSSAPTDTPRRPITPARCSNTVTNRRSDARSTNILLA